MYESDNISGKRMIQIIEMWKDSFFFQRSHESLSKLKKEDDGKFTKSTALKLQFRFFLNKRAFKNYSTRLRQ